MQRKMEQGGFHGYQKSQNSGSAAGMKLSDINMRLAEINNTKNGNNNNVVNNGGATGAGAGGSAPAAPDDNECTVREQDRFMPIANVIRIMRKILPPHAKISDDAKETIQECVSEYISFITGEANERCQREQRKTITAEDVLWAMSKLGFDDYIEPLTLYLHRFREMEGDRGSMRTDSFMKTSSSSRMPFAAAEYHAAAAAASATGSFGFGVAGFAPFNHHGFFGYLKEASAPNGAAAAGSSSQQNSNGDHQAQHDQYNNNK